MARNDLSNSDSMDELLEHPAPFYERVKAMIKTKIHCGAWPLITVFLLKASWSRCLAIAE